MSPSPSVGVHARTYVRRSSSWYRDHHPIELQIIDRSESTVNDVTTTAHGRGRAREEELGARERERERRMHAGHGGHAWSPAWGGVADES